MADSNNVKNIPVEFIHLLTNFQNKVTNKCGSNLWYCVVILCIYCSYIYLCHRQNTVSQLIDSPQLRLPYFLSYQLLYYLVIAAAVVLLVSKQINTNVHFTTTRETLRQNRTEQNCTAHDSTMTGHSHIATTATASTAGYFSIGREVSMR